MVAPVCKRQHPIKHNGFTYLGLLFFIAIMSITLTLASTLWSFAQQRERERELLFVGHQFRHAIGLYYEHTPGTVKKYPNSLNDLLQDNRYVTTQRYLRQIYRDPITLESDWETVSAPEGGVMGVYSKSDAATIKTESFRNEDRLLEGKNRYSDWKFIYQPKWSEVIISGKYPKITRD